MDLLKFALEDEENFRLDKIVCKSGNNYILIFKKLIGNFLNDLHKLDYGCKRAIEMSSNDENKLNLFIY